MKLVFFGTPQFAADIMTGLIDQGVEIVAVVTSADARVGRKQVVTSSAVKHQALSREIQVFTPEQIKDTQFMDAISSITADAWLVIAYGKILPQIFLDLMPGKVINIHPSRLPQYRGPAPMQAALRNGDQSTATTLMVMDRKMDHGPIIGQRDVIIEPDEIYSELETHMVGECVQLVQEFLPQYLDGSIQAIPQDHDQASYVSLLSKKDGRIDWNNSAQDIYNQYRAYTPWPGTYTMLQGKKINLECVGVSERSSSKPGRWNAEDGMSVETNQGSIVVKRVKPEGKNWMKPDQFMNGYGLSGVFDDLAQ